MKFAFGVLILTVGLSAGAQKTAPSQKVTPAKEAPLTETSKGEGKKPDLAPAGTPDAKNEPTVLENVKAGAEKVQQSLATTRAHRSERDWTITGNYNFFEMWVVTKYGFTLGWNRSPSSTYEFEFMKGSVGLGKYGIDLADISETRMSLIWRSYGKRQSFNFITGLYYNQLEAGFGSDYLTSVSGGYVDALSIKTLGITWGLGNRWITKGGFVWGFDWFAIHIPILILEKDDAFTKASNNVQYREDVDDAINFFSRLPAVGALKIQLGFSW